MSATTDHIQGYDGAGVDDTDAWAMGNDGTKLYEPMRRGTGEKSSHRSIGFKPMTKYVEAGTYQVSAETTYELINDMKRGYDIDIMAMIKSGLVDEVSQSINLHILSRLFALGWTSNRNFEAVTGKNLNLNLDTSTQATAQTPAYVMANGQNASATWGAVADYSLGGSQIGGQKEIQDRVIARTLAVANIVAQRNKRGSATFIVTNLQLGTAFQSRSMFPDAQVNTLSKLNGNLYPVGEYAGMKVYIDPNMSYNDNRVLVGRKGADNEPGTKFMVYMLAESVETVVSETMTPKILLKSRYALVDTGFHPEAHYFTFAVKLPSAGII